MAFQHLDLHLGLQQEPLPPVVHSGDELGRAEVDEVDFTRLQELGNKDLALHFSLSDKLLQVLHNCENFFDGDSLSTLDFEELLLDLWLQFEQLLSLLLIKRSLGVILLYYLSDQKEGPESVDLS